MVYFIVNMLFIPERNKKYSSVCALFILVIGVSCAFCLPENPQVIEGEAQFVNPDENTLKIITNSPHLIINYQDFSISDQEVVCFIQPSSEAVALNRVVGDNISYIFGTLRANGRIFIINPKGIVFGSNSCIDVAGLVASSLNIKDTDFVDNRYKFYRDSDTSVVINRGGIKSQEGGFVALIGASVRNEGEIQANLGSVVLASGEEVVLNIDDEGKVGVVIPAQLKEEVFCNNTKLLEAVKNQGEIVATGGKIILASKSLDNIFKYGVNQKGLMEANSIEFKDGEVYLVSNQRINIEGNIEAQGGKVFVDSQGANFKGTIKCKEGIYNMNSQDTFLSGTYWGDQTWRDEGNIILSGNLTVNNGDINILADTDAGGGHDGFGDFYYGDASFSIKTVNSGDVNIYGADLTCYNIISAGNINLTSTRNTTLYVDDDYTDNNPLTRDFSSIQCALDSAVSVGADFTVNVFSGTYNETVNINKTVNIVGEDKDTTIIDGEGAGSVISINANNVKIKNLHLKNASTGIVAGNNGVISNCKITDLGGGYGISLFSKDGNIIEKCDIDSGNMFGIYLYYADNNRITGNEIHNTSFGIYLDSGCNNNIIEGNTIYDNNYGVAGIISDSGWGGISNPVNYNNIYSNNNYGVYNSGNQTADATKNWWGQDSGPQANSVSGDVDTSSYLHQEWESQMWVDDDYSSVSTPTGYDYGTLFYSNIQGAVDEAPYHTVINVEPGLYNETIDISKPLTLTSTQGASLTTIDAQELDSVIDVHSNEVNIKGFTLKNPSPNGGACVYINASLQDINIEDNVMLDEDTTLDVDKTNNIDYGVFMDDGCQKITIEGNTFTNFSRGIFARRIYYNKVAPLIEDNYFYNCGYAIKLYGIARGSSQVQIINNYFEETLEGSTWYGIYAYISSFYAKDNVFIKYGMAGMDFWTYGSAIAGVGSTSVPGWYYVKRCVIEDNQFVAQRTFAIEGYFSDFLVKDNSILKLAGNGYPRAVLIKGGTGYNPSVGAYGEWTFEDNVIQGPGINSTPGKDYVGIWVSGGGYGESAITVKDTTIKNFDTGIQITRYGDRVGKAQIEDNVIKNVDTGVLVEDDVGVVNITNTCFIDNQNYGVNNTTTVNITATGNYWGASSGPYHPVLNPQGEGCRVSDNVDFIPWLNECPFIQDNTSSNQGLIITSWGFLYEPPYLWRRREALPVLEEVNNFTVGSLYLNIWVPFDYAPEFFTVVVGTPVEE